MSKINTERGTPVVATVVTGLFAGTLTFLFDIEVLAELVSIGTLFVFTLVAGSILIKHYGRETSGKSNIPYIVVRIGIQVILSIVLCEMVKGENWGAVSVIALLFLATTCSYFTMPRNNLSLKFRVPLIPLIPNLCVLFNVYLISSLGFWAYVRFIVWNFIGTCVYFFYGVIHTSDPLETGHAPQKEINLVAMKRDSLREDALLLSGERSA